MDRLELARDPSEEGGCCFSFVGTGSEQRLLRRSDVPFIRSFVGAFVAVTILSSGEIPLKDGGSFFVSGKVRFIG